MRYITPPWRHQRKALKFLYPRSFGALYTDMGSGKTKIMVDLIVNRGFKRVLIVAPKKVCRVWAPQVATHAAGEPLLVLDLSGVAGRAKRATVLQGLAEAGSGSLIVVINYDSVWREPFKKFALKFGFDCVICDESHRIKSPGSKCSRALHMFGKRVKNRFLMSGTPLAQSPLDIYAQYRFLDSSIFGTNNGAFKAQYANLIPMPGGYSKIDKKNPYKNLDELHEKMFSCAFNVDVDQSLPETQDIDIEFDLPKTTQKHYEELRKEGVLELREGDVTAGNILAIMTRLQQLVSGYLPVQDGDGSTTVVEIDDARRTALKELLEGIPPDEPVVIFAKFRKDIKNIRKTVHELGRKSSELSGRKDTLHNWQAGKTTVLVVQIASGAEGLDLTRARYCIYYTLTHSLSQYKQSRKRIHRPGQTRPVIYYRLIARAKKGKTIDQRIVESLDNNEEVIKAIMRGTSKL